MSQIKLIVLDLDGTLYDIADVIRMAYNIQVSFLASKRMLSRENAELFLAQHGVFPYVNNNTKSATELFAQLGFDMWEWREYRERHFHVADINQSRAVATDLIAQLSSDYNLVLLSSNTRKVIGDVLSHLKIKESFFREFVCSDTFIYGEGFTKKTAFEYIAKKYETKYKDMVSVGDRYLTDILPMLELGGNGILVTSPQLFSAVVRDLEKLDFINQHYYEYLL